MDYKVRAAGKAHKIVIQDQLAVGQSAVVELDKNPLPITLHRLNSEQEIELLSINKKLVSVRIVRAVNGFPSAVEIDGTLYPVEIEKVESTRYRPVAPPKKAEGKISAILPGLISEIYVKPGEQVVKGQTLLVLEAMKMENDVNAPIDGVVSELPVGKGQVVSKGDHLLTIQEA